MNDFSNDMKIDDSGAGRKVHTRHNKIQSHASPIEFSSRLSIHSKFKDPTYTAGNFIFEFDTQRFAVNPSTAVISFNFVTKKIAGTVDWSATKPLSHSYIDLIKSVTVRSRHGQLIEHIDRVNIAKGLEVYKDENIITAERGLGLGSTKTFSDGTTHYIHVFTCPMSYISNFFSLNQFIPAQLASGLRVEIELENPVVAAKADLTAYDALTEEAKDALVEAGVPAFDIGMNIHKARIDIDGAKFDINTERGVSEMLSNGYKISWNSIEVFDFANIPGKATLTPNKFFSNIHRVDVRVSDALMLTASGAEKPSAVEALPGTSAPVFIPTTLSSTEMKFNVGIGTFTTPVNPVASNFRRAVEFNKQMDVGLVTNSSSLNPSLTFPTFTANLSRSNNTSLFAGTPTSQSNALSIHVDHQLTGTGGDYPFTYIVMVHHTRTITMTPDHVYVDV